MSSSPELPSIRTVRAAGSRRATRPDVVAGLRSRWDRGDYLAALARGVPWEPIAVPLRPPSAADVAADYTGVQDWVTGWQRPGRCLRVEFARVGGRHFGVNELPRRAWVDTPEALWALLGVRADVDRYLEIVSEVRRELPDASDWVAEHPITVLAHAAVWSNLVSVVRWLRDDAPPGASVRQIDVPGVDTKFVERHRGLLTDLLDVCLPAARIDGSVPRHDFARRYRFVVKPSYVRLRRLDGDGLYPQLASAELGLRTSDLARLPVACRTVFVVENEVSYLALPAVPDAVAVYGAGYAVSLLAPLGWLADRDLVYWGDVDTHGFVMLDRLRGAFGALRSLLMDRDTFFAHEAHWGHEPAQVNAVLDRLTAEEAGLYCDLVEATYGPSLRLEQERIRFGAVHAALTPWTTG
jgi:hypothetical protein